MPLENLHTYPNAAWALWKIEEDERTLAADVAPYEVPPPQVTNVFKRLEFLAGRVLLKSLLTSRGLKFQGLTKIIPDNLSQRIYFIMRLVNVEIPRYG